MTLKQIMVHVEPGAASEARLNYAIALARRFGAGLTGLTVTLPPTEIPLAVMGDPELYGAAVEAAQESAAYARAQFYKMTSNCGLTTDWRDGNGNPADVISAEAGCADLLILGRQDHRDLDGGFYTLAPADVVMTCGRPVVVVPEKAPADFEVKRILLAWKNTPEAARAAHDAIPFLIQAEEVALTEIVSSRAGSGRYAVAAETMADHLRAHGATVVVSRVQDQGFDAGELLIDLASDSGADLIVAGAYGHSRLREWALGGVTTSLLHAAKSPCLFSH